MNKQIIYTKLNYISISNIKSQYSVHKLQYRYTVTKRLFSPSHVAKLLGHI